MTSDDMKVSKGLECHFVALPGVGHMPAKGENEQEVARVFYVAATRATLNLVMGGLGSHSTNERRTFNTKLARLLAMHMHIQQGLHHQALYRLCTQDDRKPAACTPPVHPSAWL